MLQGPVPVDTASAHDVPCQSMLAQDLSASGCGSEAAEALKQHLPALRALDLSNTYLMADSRDQDCHLGNAPGLTRLLLNHAGRCSHPASHACTGSRLQAQWRQSRKQCRKRRAQSEVQPTAQQAYNSKGRTSPCSIRALFLMRHACQTCCAWRCDDAVALQCCQINFLLAVMSRRLCTGTWQLGHVLNSCPHLLHLELDHITSIPGVFVQPEGRNTFPLQHLSWVSSCLRLAPCACGCTCICV